MKNDTKRKLVDNIRHVKERIACACVDAGRDPSDVTLVAVTKYVEDDVAGLLLECGICDLGESRVQVLSQRAESLAKASSSNKQATKPRWHLVGHLQRNKIRAALPWVHMIQSVDSLRLAEEIDAYAGQIDRTVDVLLQVNVSEEKSKHGVAVGAANHLAESIATLPYLRLKGLMAMGPLSEDRNVIRAAFVRCRELFEEIANEMPVGDQFRELSMGMSNDFELGIASGATIVRIGQALFDGIDASPRQARKATEAV